MLFTAKYLITELVVSLLLPVVKMVKLCVSFRILMQRANYDLTLYAFLNMTLNRIIIPNNSDKTEWNIHLHKLLFKKDYNDNRIILEINI